MKRVPMEFKTFRELMENFKAIEDYDTSIYNGSDGRFDCSQFSDFASDMVCALVHDLFKDEDRIFEIWLGQDSDSVPPLEDIEGIYNLLCEKFS